MNPFAFLIDTLFHLFTLALLLRFLLQLVRADFLNPISQAIVAITNPVLVPLRRLIPRFRSIDTAGIVAMLLVKMLGLTLVEWIQGASVSPGRLAVFAVWQLFDLAFLTYIVTILVQAIISWINPGARTPAVLLLNQLNHPLLRPARRLLPPLGGSDLSPLFVLIGLQFLRLLLESVARTLL